jgi:hypothetical protein
MDLEVDVGRAPSGVPRVAVEADELALVHDAPASHTGREAAEVG